MIMMDSSTYLISEQNLKESKNSDDDSSLSKNYDNILSETTLINTNLNSNLLDQPLYTNNLIDNDNSSNLKNLKKRNASCRRAEQLKRWKEQENQIEDYKNQIKTENLLKKLKGNLIFKKCKKDKKIQFSDSTLFLAACASSDYDEIHRLLDNNLVDINVGNIDGLTALHHACIDDNIELVEFLLKKGADINCVDNEGWSPLHATASCGHLKIAELLIQYGADCKLANVDLELAYDLSENDDMHRLLERALIEQTNETKFDKFRRFEEQKMEEDVLEMIKTGIYDNKTHKKTGATILHVAACKGYINVIKMLFENKLLKKQIDINVKDNENWTPLTAAIYWNNPKVVELLLKNDADVNIVTNSGQCLEQLTDSEYILNLIAERREKLKDQEALIRRIEKEEKEKKEKEISNKQANNSITTAESETQRKAHAKRARESRRSTQGILVEDVNKAKDQLLTSLKLTYSNDNNVSNDKKNTDLETLIETTNIVKDDSSLINPSPYSSLQKISKGDSCEVIEVNSLLDNVDGKSFKTDISREFLRPYRSKITVDETDENFSDKVFNVEQNLDAIVNLNYEKNYQQEDELCNDVVLSLKRDSSTSLQNDQKNLENFQSNIDVNKIEMNDGYLMKKDMSQDSLDEKNVNYENNNFIDINPSESYSFVNKNLNNCFYEKIDNKNSLDNSDNFINKQSVNKQISNNQNLKNEIRDSTKQSFFNNLQTNSTKFEVPVLIETPCTPEPPIEEEKDNDFNDSFSRKNDNFKPENNLTDRKKSKKYNVDDISFIEKINNYNPNRNLDFRVKDKNYESYSLQNANNSNTKNSFNIYKKLDEDTKTPISRSRPSSISSTNSYKTDLLKNEKTKDTFNNDSLINKYKNTEDEYIEENKNLPIDYKKLYEELLIEFEKFKNEVNKKENDFLREKRQMQRKISELEEELIQMENIKEDNTRLKNENGALVRVISKLSK